MAEARLPLLTIGGFLGAGKTTLVNQLLGQADGQRIVVFVNDFGAINIDIDLVETVAEDRVSLANGCVCCSLNGDFVAAVADFARRATPPDAIVVEASGVADPRALDASLAALETAGLIRIDLSVYLVDADRFGRLGYADTELVIDHAAASDLVLLNKADLASERRLAEIESTLAEAAPYAKVLAVTRANVPMALLYAVPHRHGAGHWSARLAPKQHAQDYVQWSAESQQPIDREGFNALAKVMAQHCWRAKGVVRFADAPSVQYQFNLVGTRATLEAVDKVGPLRLVAIGRAQAHWRDELSMRFDAATSD